MKAEMYLADLAHAQCEEKTNKWHLRYELIVCQEWAEQFRDAVFDQSQLLGRECLLIHNAVDFDQRRHQTIRQQTARDHLAVCRQFSQRRFYRKLQQTTVDWWMKQNIEHLMQLVSKHSGGNLNINRKCSLGCERRSHNDIFKLYFHSPTHKDIIRCKFLVDIFSAIWCNRTAEGCGWAYDGNYCLLRSS